MINSITLSTDRKWTICNKCQHNYNYNTKLFLMRTYTFYSVYDKDDSGLHLLFWSQGKARKKLLKLYGFQCGMKYR